MKIAKKEGEKAARIWKKELRGQTTIAKDSGAIRYEKGEVGGRQVGIWAKG